MVRRFSTKRRKILDLNCSLKRPKCYVQCYLSSAPRHLVLEFVSVHFLVPIRRLTPSTQGGSLQQSAGNSSLYQTRFVLLLSRGGCQDRSKAQGSGPCPVGVRGFKSHPPHQSGATLKDW